MPRIAAVLLACSMWSLTGGAHAWNWTVDAHITAIQPSSVGTTSGTGTPTTANAALFLLIDETVGGCVANTQFHYWAPKNFGGDPVTSQNERDRQLTNTRAILSSLQVALSLGYKVRLHGFNADAGGYCRLEFITLLSPT